MLRTRSLTTALALLPLACAAVPLHAAVQDGPGLPLDLAACDAWRAVRDAQLSRTGAWVGWELVPADGGDGLLEVAARDGSQAYAVERGEGARFDASERWLVCRVKPSRADARAHEAAQRERKKAGKQKDEDELLEPKHGLAIVELAGGARTTVERVKSFALAEEGDGGWLAYLLEEELPEKKDEAAEDGAAAEQGTEGEEPEDDRKPKEGKEDGTVLVLRDLASGVETRFEHVVSYGFSKTGAHLVYATSTKADGDDGLYLVRIGGEARVVLEGEGDYRSAAFDEAGTRIAFLTNTNDYAAEQPAWELHVAPVDGDTAALDVSATLGLPGGWGVSEHRAPRFSESGRRLFFGTAPLAEPEQEELPADEVVEVDVWSWTDPELQPMQLVQLEEERKRSYLAVAEGARLVQLALPEQPEIALGEKDDSPLAVGVTDRPYRAMISWERDVPRDVWVIDTVTGARELRLEALVARPRLSPGGRWIYWWDGAHRAWFGAPTAGGETRELSAGIDRPLWNERHDTPSLPRAYGDGGWLADDAGLFVYDEHDVWLLDPTGDVAPRCVTKDVGRSGDLRLRIVDLDAEEPALDPDAPLLLAAQHLGDMRAGFFELDLAGGRAPVQLVLAEKRYSTPVRARDGDVLRFTREDFSEYPDVWTADLDLGNARRHSDANPQQARYAWGDARQVRWRSTDGRELRGILYTPDDFDPERRHPLLVYFYERNSERLYSHHTPVPGRSSIAFPAYTNRGYCVFVPDIPYRVGYPGQSAEHAVLPGVAHLVDQGFIDPARVGVQGHSWGGYQIAHLVTRSRLFAAAVAGAPVSNMTSAYGGIRWKSGMSRMFQYEDTQSRIGGTLWDETTRFIENSPIFFADEVRTPLLILHNDDDGAVPWYQGIELFVALRRLGQPCWMLNYNGEPHGIMRYANRRDYATRMQQFFDHYLLDAPRPEWMERGVPALEKGRTLGLDLVTPKE